MSERYILDSMGQPVPCADLFTWGRWLELNPNQRKVANDTIGNVNISTVFLGLDHQFGVGGPPILWETMIFGGTHDQEQWRYTSRLGAMRGHGEAVALVKRDLGWWRTMLRSLGVIR